MARCKACDAPIIWAETENGNRIPLDAKSEKRFVLGREGSWGDTKVAAMKDTYTSHFATCPNANDFRKKKVKLDERR